MDPWHIDMFHLTLRLVLALVLGGLIGLEREQNNHAAGLRTHILVCLGAALIMLLSMYGFADFADEENVRLDPARLAAQVISGIGFLGAGVILFNGFSLTGLTTAASLWVVAAIGLAVGAGFYYPASLVTVLVLINLFILNKLEKRFFHAKRIRTISILISDRPGNLGAITLALGTGVEIRRVSVEEPPADENALHDDDTRSDNVKIQLTVKFAKRNSIVSIVDALRELHGVHEVSIE